MKGFLEEYGLIIVVVAVILLMLLFGKSGYAKSIQNAILGSANHIVETGENITKKEVNVTAGDTIEIEGNKYVVLESKKNNQALVMTADSIGNKNFQSGSRSDGQYYNTYEESKIDKYLENEWYNSLSSTMKAAIQPTNIKQVSYDTMSYGKRVIYTKYETGPNDQVYNTISRHAFLPNVSEIEKVVDLKNPDKVNPDKMKAFLNGTSIWTRDSCTRAIGAAWYLNASNGSLDSDGTGFYHGMRPAFVIDLSKVDYTEAGHVDYK